MRIDHLKYLVDVADTGSISQAAERLYISQQGLSQSIRQLEKTFGVTLLIRTGNRIFLTEIGMRVVTKAKDILMKYDELLDEVNSSMIQSSIENNKELVILTTPLLSLTVLCEVLNKYCQKHPYINLVIHELLPAEILESFEVQRDAIGLFSIPDYQLNSLDLRKYKLNFQPFYEGESVVCVGKNSPLSKRSIFKLSEIIEHPIAVYDSGQNSEILEYVLAPVGKPNIYLKTSNLKLYRETIANGLAIGVTSTFLENFEKNESVVSIPLEDGYKLYSGFLLSDEKPLNAAMLDFIDEIENYIKSF